MNFRKQYHRLNSDTLLAADIISGRFGSPDEPTSVREKSRLAGLWRAVSITARPPQSVSIGITKQTADRSSLHILFHGSAQTRHSEVDEIRAPVANRERMPDGAPLR
ncbi:hypothetical protein EJ076_28680 [Mesorhizobium sp. M7D.F.Ca.US.005.01.1.1]|uniref:hypothetical protein n=1 Tax=Mesorhizobium sp. M7D.F.Ca.US.005.01.1.1 TaxID=2493678 RepID=UPI000F75977B|nr:hypothetical protein [Mesorhizobium sp. M7D.F.Ca.US.005.01.1.1]AZO44793.1 hypothetical protein EJ076_28680 [Mesorhizobium sp. M7D.F.Ca.US.005.01.1.1]